MILVEIRDQFTRNELVGIGGGGLKARAEGPWTFLNLESLKCHFPGLWEDLTEF
jgi:hypothetical protein